MGDRQDQHTGAERGVRVRQYAGVTQLRNGVRQRLFTESGEIREFGAEHIENELILEHVSAHDHPNQNDALDVCAVLKRGRQFAGQHPDHILTSECPHL